MKTDKNKYSPTFILAIGLKKTFSKLHYWIITLAVSINILFLYYFILIQKTTWDSFLQSNTLLYIWSQIILSLGNAILIGATISMFLNVIEERRQTSKTSLLQTTGSLLFSAAATGCSVCSAFLLPTLGIAASLTAMPFGGLEIKFMSLLILLYAMYEYAKPISGLCPLPKESILSFKKGRLELNITKATLPQLKPLLVFVLFVLTVYALPRLPISWRLQTQTSSPSVNLNKDKNQGQAADIFAKINPPEGYQLNAKYGDIGPKMIEMGVIDLEKFKKTYADSGQPLNEEQLEILSKGSDKKIKITSESSYFFLNFFWAFGLANQTKILTEGDIVKYGEGQVGGFASTGGWTLTKSGNPMDYYAKRAIVPLSQDQEKLVNEVASNVYRPCCGNSTSFPDCNHGMALLGIFELMAAQGATASEMYEAGKYINSYWFPANAFDVALYFKSKEGKEFKDIDAKTFLSNEFFSANGAQTVKKWLVENGVQEQPPAQGGGCGV